MGGSVCVKVRVSTLAEMGESRGVYEEYGNLGGKVEGDNGTWV